ncbi:MAG: AAA family ATPase [Mycolicibacterium sp.]|nr:AAA family ATPase [Mycolicibacterium sp.]
MHLQLLGPLQAVVDGRPVELGPPKQRAVLAVLALAGGAVVSADRLIDAVWGDDAPASATAGLHAYISNLRKALRGDSLGSPIVRQAPGYRLALPADARIDLAEFTASCTAAREAAAAGAWTDALAEADTALALQRGPLLADLADADWVTAEAVRVDELRTECTETRIAAMLALGRTTEALTGALALRADQPLRDRACWLHMLAAYRAGRTAEAMDAYTDYARHLDTELGLTPGPELRELQTLILAQSPELATWPRPSAWTGATDVQAPVIDPPELPSPEPTTGALVGRERELPVITALLDDIDAGDTSWLVLTGPPGIGKTRLAEEAAARGNAPVIWVDCPDESGTPPWWPMRRLVRALGADADEILAVPPDADPDAARFLVYERLHLLLATAEPRLLVIDDAQWADAASLGALAYLAGVLRGHPVGVVLTVRDGRHGPELDRLLTTLARSDRGRHLPVPALAADDVAALANGIAEEPLSTDEAALLAERTGGNPFFVGEYARLPRRDRGTDIPSAVRSVLDRRLAGLADPVITVLRTAAVIGDRLDAEALGLLRAVTALDLDGLADLLDEAADARILVTAHASSAYEFAHGLLREHLLAGMPPMRRQRLHARVAELLGDAPENAGRRAQHLIDALPLVDPVDVVDACRVAAEQAAAQWSSETAAHWWQAALAAYELIPAAGRSDADGDALTVALLQALARAGRGQTVLDAAADGLTEALASGRSVTVGRIAAELLRVSGGWPWPAPGGDPGALLELLWRAVDLVGGDPAAGARVRAALAVGSCYHPDPSVVSRLLADADTLAEQCGDPDVAADVLLGRLIAYSGVSDYSRASLDWAAELIVLPHTRGREDTVTAHSVATMATFNLADLPATRAHLQAGSSGSEQLRLPVLRVQLRWLEAVLAVWEGDFAEARRHHRIAAAVHGQTELYGAGSALLALASLLREEGDLSGDGIPFDDHRDDGGEDMLAVVRTAICATPEDAAALAAYGLGDEHVWSALGRAALMAHLCADFHLADYAPEVLARLDGHRDEIAVIGQVGVIGPVALATARLHTLLGDTDAARADLARARRIAQRGGGVPSLLRCRLLARELDSDARDDDLAADAQRLGMHGVAAAARR